MFNQDDTRKEEVNNYHRNLANKEAQFDVLFTILILAVLCSSLVFVAYYIPGIPIGSGGIQTMNRENFLDTIRFNGGYITTIGIMNVTVFSTKGIIYDLNNKEQIIVYEYNSGSDLAKDAARISGNGSFIDGKQYAWQGAPHFYKNGRVLVLYLGSDQNTLALLSYVVGQPFAGASITYTTACSVSNKCPNNELCVTFVGDTLCMQKDPCTLCGTGYSCKTVGEYPVEVICAH